MQLSTRFSSTDPELERGADFGDGAGTPLPVQFAWGVEDGNEVIEDGVAEDFAFVSGEDGVIGGEEGID
eukprot:CAMPEP_0195518556 /NCGR_PEP_ID=MMETSP0794_2-20130614/13136_1 /TAXON_ID=515487 /ORGANISM="Stephanopyxis turris, Strain CCMP 815" /LENGTH=68 /DNA_ID=CAMNT_0040647543 /DNA_START=249 /DNA_END=455 /DNA_ORIENTATION=-